MGGRGSMSPQRGAGAKSPAMDKTKGRASPNYK